LNRSHEEETVYHKLSQICKCQHTAHLGQAVPVSSRSPASPCSTPGSPIYSRPGANRLNPGSTPQAIRSTPGRLETPPPGPVRFHVGNMSVTCVAPLHEIRRSRQTTAFLDETAFTGTYSGIISG
jgi:hypothetical protein